MLINQTNKEKFYALCEEDKTIPLFMQAWWMDAVCNYENWDVLIYEKNGKIQGVLVYHFIKKLGFKIIIQPQLTQFNGIWINYKENLSENEKIRFEKEVMTNLIKQLEKLKFSYYDQNFHPSITNWLPFFWKGFSQTTRYTYQIQDISDVEKCFEQFTYAKKKQISKAKKNLFIDFELTGEEFYNELQQNLKNSNKKVFYSKNLFLTLYRECLLRKQGIIIAARDDEKKIHAANFIVWDNNCSYNLISTLNQEFRSSGASTLIIFEAIKLRSTQTKIFDFEGSMHENIENSFRQFGSIQKPYFRIRKHNSITFKAFLQLRKWLYSK
ncbi:MAG: hypothetical protein P4L34_02920 [Paludibacter sp.]|nr:hypothetical protein [Paludibacter sp.]